MLTVTGKIVVAAFLCTCIAALIITLGCDASGGMGGQAFNFKNITVNAGGTFTAHTSNVDGGTALAGTHPPAATTQPATSPLPSPPPVKPPV